MTDEDKKPPNSKLPSTGAILRETISKENKNSDDSDDE